MVILALTTAKAMILLAMLVAVVLFILIVGFGINHFRKKTEQTQHIISDKELLELIQNQPDGLISTKQLMKATGLKKSTANNRISLLSQFNMLRTFYSGLTGYYGLKEPILDLAPPQLSNQPFLTVDDLLLLFKRHSGKLTLQKICIDTNLPVNVIIRELDYFVKEKMVKKLVSMDANGVAHSRIYVLEEPYRSNPDIFMEKEAVLNLELEKIYLETV